MVPLTSNTGRLYPGEAAVSIAGKPAKAMADQLMTAAKERLKEKLGTLSREDMRAVKQAIKIRLGMGL